MRDTLHWLPIRQRIDLKVLTFMRNCLVRIAPCYLGPLQFISSSSDPDSLSLLSEDQGVLLVPRTRSSTTEHRSFAFVGPLAWNNLYHKTELSYSQPRCTSSVPQALEVYSL